MRLLNLSIVQMQRFYATILTNTAMPRFHRAPGEADVVCNHSNIGTTPVPFATILSPFHAHSNELRCIPGRRRVCRAGAESRPGLRGTPACTSAAYTTPCRVSSRSRSRRRTGTTTSRRLPRVMSRLRHRQYCKQLTRQQKP